MFPIPSFTLSVGPYRPIVVVVVPLRSIVVVCGARDGRETATIEGEAARTKNSTLYLRGVGRSPVGGPTP